MLTPELSELLAELSERGTSRVHGVAQIYSRVTDLAAALQSADYVRVLSVLGADPLFVFCVPVYAARHSSRRITTVDVASDTVSFWYGRKLRLTVYASGVYLVRGYDRFGGVVYTFDNAHEALLYVASRI